MNATSFQNSKILGEELAPIKRVRKHPSRNPVGSTLLPFFANFLSLLNCLHDLGHGTL